MNSLILRRKPIVVSLFPWRCVDFLSCDVPSVRRLGYITKRHYAVTPIQIMFADDVVLCGENEVFMTEYLASCRESLKTE